MNIWRPYTQMLTAHAPIKVQRAQGAHLYLENGQKILDGISSWWVITHGHCHPAIVEAVRAQSQLLEQVVFANFTHDSAEELATLLSEFLPEELSSVFFSDNGSTAVEAAMKMAYQYCAHVGKSSKRKFVAFANSYHGDTCGAMSVSADSVFTKSYQDLRFEVLRCKQGQRSTDPLESWISDLGRILESRQHEIVAVILEPLVQGAGGMIVWPKESLQEIFRLCRHFGVLLIFDEVMTGFGRTGTVFAFDQLSFVPDFVCLSKGVTGGFLPLGLTIASKAIYEAFLSQSPSRMLFHGHSFTGNSLACAAAVANLKIFRTTEVLTDVSRIQRVHAQSLNKLNASQELRDVRVIGGIGVAELAIDIEYGAEFSRKLFQACLREGVFVRSLGNTIYLMPPYCTTSQELADAWEVVSLGIRSAAFG